MYCFQAFLILMIHAKSCDTLFSYRIHIPLPIFPSFPPLFSPLLTPQNLLRLTLLNTSVVWLDELLSDLSAIDKECVTLRALVTEDSGTIECEIQLLSELCLWVCDEAELGGVLVMCFSGISSPNAWKILYGRRKARCATDLWGWFFTSHLFPLLTSQLTPLFPSLSKASPHAFVTNGSLTATTKTFPAFLMPACFMNPGMWELEQPGPGGSVRFAIWKVWEKE